ncbi:MAG: 50S ribosomal protein L3 [Spirochaetia bacterium]
MLGLIGKKIGMTQVFDEQGTQTPVTVIEVEPNVVIGERTPEKHGYSAVVLGYGVRRKSRIRKPYAGQFPESIDPSQILTEVKDFDGKYKLGEKIGLETFEGVHFVDVRGISKGKGFQGVMKRHGFAGGPRTHGSLVHRELGSTGLASGKVFKGTKMPGRMGAERKTVQNLQVVKVDPQAAVLLVKGAVPGRRGTTLFVAKAKKK